MIALCGIYKIENTTNGHVYIGQSTNIRRRWKEHRTTAKTHTRGKTKQGNNNSLFRAFAKYGAESFVFSIVELCDRHELDAKEIYWIEYFDSYRNGYNETLGGEGNPGRYKKLEKEKIDQIIVLLETTDLSQQEIGRRFDTTQATISAVNLCALGSPTASLKRQHLRRNAKP